MTDKRPEFPTQADLDHWFTYHEVESQEQLNAYKMVRKYGKFLAQQIIENCPAGADRAAAVRKVREAVMTANAAIACKGR